MQIRNRQISRFFASVKIVSNFDHDAVTQNMAEIFIYGLIFTMKRFF